VVFFYPVLPTIPTKTSINNPENTLLPFGSDLFRTVMKTFPLLLGFQLTVRMPEIIIFLLGALILGFTLHFFWNSRKSMRIDRTKADEGISENDNWKLKYYHDMDMQEKSQEQLRQRLDESRENEQIMAIELEELQKKVKTLKQAPLPVVEPTEEPGSFNYLSQLKSAQENLQQHNQHINRLLEQIQMLKESERKYMDLHRINESLNIQLNEIKKQLTGKDSEIQQIRQQQRLTEEISERMEKAYSEYNILQEKLQKLESQMSQPHSRSIDYDELHESYFKLTKDFDEVKTRQMALWDENQRLSRILSDTEDKLREANFQRQQLQKKTIFLEELNRDLQGMSEHNKKLESQLKRISEMEAMLSRTVPEKKDFQNESGQ
jgi:DNA repair exonuclease SbcCD ATPase subunit